MSGLSIRRRSWLAAAALVALATGAPAPRAASLPAPDQVVAEAFPGGRAERKTWALDDEEMDRVEALAGSRPASKLVAGFLVSGGAAPGVALVDTHVVRTKPESLLVSMTLGGEVVRVDVLAFAEPRDYLAPERWLAQLGGRRLGPGLEVKRDIRGLTGATLTARAATAATRRCLAIAQVLAARGALPSSPALASAAPARP